MMLVATQVVYTPPPPTFWEWVKAVFDHPKYIFPMAVYYWPWTLGIVLAAFLAYSFYFEGKIKALFRAEAQSNESGSPATTSDDPFSWRRLRDEQDHNKATAAKAKAAHEKSKAEAEARRIKAGEDNRKMVSELVVEPFLAAMREVGSPGRRGLQQNRWSDNGDRKERNVQPYDGNIWYFDVYTNGRWLFGVRSGDLHVGREIVSGHSWHMSSAFNDREATTMTQSNMQYFQSCLLAIMRKYNVPLPPD